MLLRLLNAEDAAVISAMMNPSEETTAVTTAVTTEAGNIGEQISETFTENMTGISKLINDIWSGFVARLPLIGLSAVLLVVGIIVSKIVLRIMGKALDKSRLDLTIIHFLKSVVKILLYVVLITAVLTLLGVPTNSIIAVISTAGVSIALALKDSLSNIAGGFLILFAKPFKIGDYVNLNGSEGVVDTINILYTKLRTLNNRYIYIPNSVATSHVVVNVTEPAERRVDHFFSISYDSDYRVAVESIKRVIKKCDKILTDGDHTPFVRMCAHKDSSIEIEVRVWCKTEHYWDVYYDVIELVRAGFIEDGIEIPYPQLDLHIKDGKTAVPAALAAGAGLEHKE
ncbi:MAG: mechanosensitive ion channel [Ruminiclostridium sp.]|nr:mechanosensitive ion channel [Ruminiclostridium sp.]